MRRTRVLVVDDGATIRKLLAGTLATDPELQVVGTAADGSVALAKIDETRPDVMVLDLAMPVMDGLEVLAELRRSGRRFPVIVYSSMTRRGALATLDALALGASDYVTKPTGADLESVIEHIHRELAPRIRALGRAREPGPEGTIPAPSAPRYSEVRAAIVAIGASTGGPNALSEILPALPADFPAPVVVVQHMPPLFTRHLAERLDSKCSLRVREGIHGARLRPGEIWIAPGGQHLVVAKGQDGVWLGLHEGPPVHSCRPAVDELFRSVAEVYGAGALAVLLTGMGDDGALGCRAIRERGGQVLVQDAATSVVWGMPGKAAAQGLADAVLPLDRIVGEIERRATADPRGRRLAA